MERAGASGERSRIAANTPRILKEKSDGVGRTVSSTGTRHNFQKKRSTMIVSDSESSDEFMKPPPPRRSGKTLAAKEKFARKRDRAEHDRNGYVRRNNEASGNPMKMNKLDVFEFDEYDGFDSANLMRKRFDNGSVGVSGRSSFAPRRLDSSVGRSGSGRDGLFDRRRNTYVNGSGSMSSQEVSSSESDFNETMRVQGRNGVLKVKFNSMTSTLTASINHQDTEMYERPPSRKAQKREDVVVKPTFRKSNNVDNDSESEESDMSRKSKRRKTEYSKSKKEMKTKSKSTFSEPVKPGVREERRGRRGGGTEKQRLREKIKGMLTDAGWTIDYKPRRNQSYLDAVYVNPSGTAYWSIIKAYDALRKQLKDEEIDARPRKDTAAVASVSEDVVNKLARKAKKTQTEMTKRWKKVSSGSDSENESDGDDGGGAYTTTHEERIGSSVKLGGKSTKKGRNGTDWDDLHSKSKRSLYYNDSKPSSGLDSHYLHERKSKKIGRCTLLVRSSKDEKNRAIDGFNPYSGKRTLLSWLIESGVVQLRQKVQYMKRRGAKVMLEGWITREGIHCVCCSKILTVFRFEIHAGSKSCQPFQNIYLDSGASLLQCQVKAWNMQKDATNLGLHQVDTNGDDPNDDACGICGDGGDLICCDSCPSTYHQSCLGIQV